MMSKQWFSRLPGAITGLVLASLLTGCSSFLPPELPPATLRPAQATTPEEYRYVIGPGDSVNIFVWRNPEISGSFGVGPDGIITTWLVEDIPVTGKTTTQLAREIEEILSVYIRDPVVTVTASGVGPYNEQIRILGEAASPRALSYRQNMTLLDLMISTGGITSFADGNRAILLRIEDGYPVQYRLRIDDLLRNSDFSANIDMLPGDTILIPEAWF